MEHEIGRVIAGEAPGPLSLSCRPSEVDFWRCMACGYLVTKPQMRHALERDEGRMPCGHLRVTPDNITLREHVYPRVWRFALLRILGLA